MRKIISLILAVLMVSMMIPAMALAEDSATPVDYAGLVAGETFTVTVENLTSATATISVNTQLFSIDGVTAEGSIASKEVAVENGVASLEVKVNALVPAVATSRIKIVAGDKTDYQTATIVDGLLGDVNKTGKVDGADVVMLLEYSVNNNAYDTYFMNVVGDVNGTGRADGADVVAALEYSVNNSNNPYNLNTALAGGNADITVEDPFVDAPVVEQLAKPANGYAYAQNGKIYYTFDAVEGATDYVIKSGETTIATVQTATGSFDYVESVEGMKITITATAEGYTASEASDEIEVIEADASGALAKWLSENGLEDVAITVHEIK